MKMFLPTVIFLLENVLAGPAKGSLTRKKEFDIVLS